MTRAARNFIPDLPVHVVHRGNNRQRIFTRDGDYLLFRRYLEEGVSDLGICVHSYVLMSNHVHLLMTSPSVGGISKLVQCVARRYVGYFNSRYSRTGTLWEGRFHSSVIGNDFYLLACHRYIENNPVRAAMVAHPAMYPWSSHLHNACGNPDSLVTPHSAVMGLAAEIEARRRAYREMFHLSDGSVESEAFRAAARLSRPLGLPDAARRRPGRPAKKTRL
jgi:putative transposase